MAEISVVIPAYNVENYIGKIINDLKDQTFKDFEVIIVDDGSKDSTVEVIKNELKKTTIDYKLIISEKNGGGGKARNIGLSKANGKYLYFIDADDRIENTCLYELNKTIKENNADIAICNYNLVDENLKIVTNSYSLNLKNDLTFKSTDFIKNVIRGYYTIYPGSVLYRKAIIDNNEIKFTERVKYSEDREFLIKAIFHSKVVALNRKILFHYVQRASSVTHVKANLEIFHSVGTFYRLGKYLKLQNASEDILNCIYNVRIPENIVDAFRALSLSDYPKDELKLILKNKRIKEAIKKYRFSIRNKKDLKRSIKIYLFRLWPELFLIIERLRRSK
ncbi:MAG: glycosyltransferase family 2 protein [Candidatus Micrarchaeia archaeon]